MNNPIKITGEDIIGWDNIDHTGALKELGVPRFATFYGDPSIADVYAMVFEVNLDFMLRHGLLGEGHENMYKTTDEYLKYFNEGRDAYLAGAEEDPPYDTGTIEDPHYWKNSAYHKRNPWYDGYRQTRAAVMEERYKLSAFQAEVRAVIERYGLTLEYSDEYNDPYARTPEGYQVKLA